jgi:hypothetical protein
MHLSASADTELLAQPLRFKESLNYLLIYYNDYSKAESDSSFSDVR